MPMKPSELVSVAMGVCYRRQELCLLERAVKSILQQSYDHLEFLICENGSTDKAKELLKQYAERDSRIRLIDGTGTFLLSEKLNRCIKAARGSWIARQDDDDCSHRERLEKQIDFLQKNAQYEFVGCNVRIEQDASVLGVRQFPQIPTVEDFLFVQPFIHPALVFRQKCLEEVGGYLESRCYNGCEDYDLLLRLYQAGYQGANLPDVCFTYHIPSAGTSNRTLSMRYNEVRVRWRHFRTLKLLPKGLPYVFKPLAVGLLPTRVLSGLKKLHPATVIQKGKSDEWD